MLSQWAGPKCESGAALCTVGRVWDNLSVSNAVQNKAQLAGMQTLPRLV